MKTRGNSEIRWWFCGFALSQAAALWLGYGEWLLGEVRRHG